jgi:hypothetical protein
MMLLIAGPGIGARPAHADAVQYMKVCSLIGAGYAFIPGTDTCQNLNEIADNQYAAGRASTQAFAGIAMSSAIVTPFIPDNARLAISVHWATFNGKNALGIAGAIRLNNSNWALTAGIAGATDSGSVVLSTFQATPSGPYSPVRSWSSTDLMASLGASYSW